MVRMIADWLYTIRWKNLLIIGISIVAIILPFLIFYNLPLFTEFFLWALLCMSVAAIGNITNDWLDVQQDQVNKRKNIFLERKNKKTGVILMAVFLIMAATAAYLSEYSFFFMLIGGSSLVLLIMYDLILKKIPLIGNLTIALLTGFVFIGVDHIAGQRVIFSNMGFQYLQIETIAGMAFLMTLNREIIKDAEDRPGDKHAGFRTLAMYMNDQQLGIFIVIITGIILTGVYFLLSARHFKLGHAYILYGLCTFITAVLAAGFLFGSKLKKYVISTRILKAGMIGILMLYLILQFIHLK